MGQECSNDEQKNPLKEASEYLIAHYWDRQHVERFQKDVRKAVAQLPGDLPVTELINKYFRGGGVHVFPPPDENKKPRLLTMFENNHRLHVDAFPNALVNTEWESSYTKAIQSAINLNEGIRYIDLTKMTGGNVEVPFQALKQSKLNELKTAVVQIGPETAGAGEQVAEWLLENNWELAEPIMVDSVVYGGDLKLRPIGMPSNGSVLYLETFPSHRVGTRFEKILIDQIREIFRDWSIHGIDVTRVTGGNVDVFFKALKDVSKGGGTVIIGNKTLGAGEQLAAWLHYDHGWSLVGEGTAGLLGTTREFRLSDGSRLILVSEPEFYTTPGGYKTDSHYLFPEKLRFKNALRAFLPSGP